MDSFSIIKSAVNDNKISVEAGGNLELWLTEPVYKEFVPEIEALLQAQNWLEIEDAFYAHVRVGTAGIRGPLGVGPNRINVRTISEAAQGLSQFIHDFGEEAVRGGVVVGHEVRKHSRQFAEVCCE